MKNTTKISKSKVMKAAWAIFRKMDVLILFSLVLGSVYIGTNF